MLTKINENMTEYTILTEDNWQKIANSGDVITMQNITDTVAILQVVDNAPDVSIDWGFKLYPRTDKPFVATHNVYARATNATLIVVVQKD